MRLTDVLNRIGFVALIACTGGRDADQANTNGRPAAPAGGPASTIAVDGSSTVFPISQAVVAQFQKAHSASVTVAISGTGGGFKKFCRDEVTVLGASRPLNVQEASECRHAGVRYIELPIGLDGLTVVVHPTNTWASSMTVRELKLLWSPESEGKVGRWNQIRSEWPDKEIHLFGADAESGTYDYFTAAILGHEHSSRHDYSASEDDDKLVAGVAADPLALGFFGYGYYLKNADKLRVVALDDENASNGEGPVAPSLETVSNGTYQPLSRPLLMYVSKTASARPDVEAFVLFFLESAASSVREAGYVPLPPRGYELAQFRFNSGVIGSVFRGEGSQIGVTMDELAGQQK